MSKALDQNGRQKVLDILRRSFDSHDTSRQAVYHAKNGRKPFAEINRHEDGEYLYQRFGMKPFWKALRAEERAQERGVRSEILSFPETYLNAVVHLNDAEKAALEENDFDFFEDTTKTRQKVLEFLAEHPGILSVIEDGGKDIHGHSRPGRGKTSFMNVIGAVQNIEINNDTVLWMLTLDELEALPLAPVMTILKPAGVEVTATAKPTKYTLPNVEIPLDLVFRDVIEYEDPEDLFEKVVPGGIYGVLPDPHFRRCEELVRATYRSAWEEEEAAKVTPLRDFIHAVLEVRAKRDVFLHPTTLIVDEFGDLVPENPEDNHHDEKEKVKEWPKRYGKLRKKNGSLFAVSHTLNEPDSRVLAKERWFATFPRTPVPSSSRAGLGDVPLPKNKPKHIDVGTAYVWDSVNYVEVSWPNPYRAYEWHGEIDIRYPEMEAQL